MEPAITAEGLTVSYAQKTALEDVTFTLPRGVLTGVIGPNGAGKSTLMKACLGLLDLDAGRVEICGQPVKRMRRRVAYVPQRADIDWDFPITVRETVLLGRYPRLGFFRRPGRQDRDLAAASLERVGLPEYATRQIGELSGGQAQRVFLARALAQQAEVIFLDEPFVGIDAASEATIIGILQELRDSGCTIVVIHHDLSKAEEYFDRVLLLNISLTAAGTPDEALRADRLESAYGGQLPFLRVGTRSDAASSGTTGAAAHTAGGATAPGPAHAPSRAATFGERGAAA